MRSMRSHLAKHRHRANLVSRSKYLDTSSEELPQDLQINSEGEGSLSPCTTYLYVKVSHASGLIAMDSNGRSDPFCVMRVGDRKHKTSTKMRTLEPVWNETFTFRSKDVAKANGIVVFDLFDKDQWTKDDFLGRATLNVYETLPDDDQVEAIDLKLMPHTWKRVPSLIANKLQERELGYVNVVVWWGYGESLMDAIGDSSFSFAKPRESEGESVEMKVKKTDVRPSEWHPRSLPSIVHSSRGSVFEEPVVAVLILKISQVELNLDPCNPLNTHCDTKCIFKSTGRAAKRHVRRVLGNLMNNLPKTPLRTLGLPGSSNLSSEDSSPKDSATSHINSFFDRLLEDESSTDEEEDNEDSSDESASTISDFDVKNETRWFCEVKMFDQSRASETVGYVLNSGSKMDFEEHLIFVVQLPLPNTDVSISMCKRSESKKRSCRIPFHVQLFNVMDADEGVIAKSENGSMLINYRLICLDERPRLMNISHKLEREDSRLLSSHSSIPEETKLSASGGSSEFSGALSGRMFSIDEQMVDLEAEPEVLVGRVSILLDSIEMPQLKANIHSCFCVLKCQHHWAMTSSLLAHRKLSWRWLLKLPVYDPATVVSLSVFGGSGPGPLEKTTRLGKLRIRLSTLQPGHLYDCSLPFVASGTEIGYAKLSMRVSYPSEMNLMKGYVKSTYQKEIYAYGLASGIAKSQIRKEHRKLIIQWLDSSEPRISKPVSYQVLDLEKESFSRKRFAMHVRRIQHCFAFMAPISKKIKSLQAWESRCESTMVCICIWLIGWNLTAAAVLGLCLLFWMVTLQYAVPSAPPTMADPILLPPLPAETSSTNEKNALDIANPYNALKSRLDQIQTTLVKIQNILDSIASFCERIHALLSWRDPVATRLLTVGLLAAMFAVSVMGLRSCLCFVLCWSFRPPFLRSPLPPPPLNFFKRLPSKSDQIL